MKKVEDIDRKREKKDSVKRDRRKRVEIQRKKITRESRMRGERR